MRSLDINSILDCNSSGIEALSESCVRKLTAKGRDESSVHRGAGPEATNFSLFKETGLGTLIGRFLKSPDYGQRPK